jgi:hypothetical protein
MEAAPQVPPTPPPSHTSPLRARSDSAAAKLAPVEGEATASRKFTIFDTVSTVYGPGWIDSVRETDYVVKLGNWQLAQGQSPTLYLNEAALTAIPGAFPGSMVKTVYGPSRMESIRGDGAHIARPINWFLANDTHATMFLQPDAVSLAFTPGILEGDAVMTIYGQGYVESVRAEQKDVVVKLDNWALAQGQSPTLYLDPKTCVKLPGFRVGQVIDVT